MEYRFLKRSPIYESLAERLQPGPQLIQVILGPRQVGKTTTLRTYLESHWAERHLYFSADGPTPPTAKWLVEQWNLARQMHSKRKTHVIIALDEVQKIPRWSEAIKACFDEDRYNKLKITPVLLGSSALMMEKGLSESLTGRFEVIHFPHWTLTEIEQAFGLHMKEFLLFGGYPASYSFVNDIDRWHSFVSEAIIETTVGRDILSLAPIEKPALLRQTFALACSYPAQILTYQKIMGQLVDAGNTTTIANYLSLLSKAFLISPLQKWSSKPIRQRASSPKIIVLNNALISATLKIKPEDIAKDSSLWGHVVENAIGAHLLNSGLEVYYWRERDLEVDFVVRDGKKIYAIETTIGEKNNSTKGLAAFQRKNPNSKAIVIGGVTSDFGVEDFLLSDPRMVLKGIK